jgi:hypothetical protein
MKFTSHIPSHYQLLELLWNGSAAKGKLTFFLTLSWQPDVRYANSHTIYRQTVKIMYLKVEFVSYGPVTTA